MKNHRLGLDDEHEELESTLVEDRKSWLRRVPRRTLKGHWWKNRCLPIVAFNGLKINKKGLFYLKGRKNNNSKETDSENAA